MKNILAVLILVASLSSCKTFVPYTDALRIKNNWTEDDLKKIQFYVSDPIILQRKVGQSNAEIISGKIKMIDGQKIDEVIVLDKTPGVLVAQMTDQKLAISFENDNNYYLKFGPNPMQKNQYVLLASDWRNKLGKLKYNDLDYITSPESADAILLVNLKRIFNRENNQRIAKGRKVQ